MTWTKSGKAATKSLASASLSYSKLTQCPTAASSKVGVSKIPSGFSISMKNFKEVLSVPYEWKIWYGGWNSSGSSSIFLTNDQSSTLADPTGWINKFMWGGPANSNS